MPLPQAPRNSPWFVGARPATSGATAHIAQSCVSSGLIREAVSAAPFPPTMCQSVSRLDPVPPSLRSVAPAPAPAVARVSAALPAPLQLRASASGCADSAAPTAAVSRCGFVPATLRPFPPAAQPPAPPPEPYLSFSSESCLTKCFSNRSLSIPLIALARRASLSSFRHQSRATSHHLLPQRL
jgi:hypothetical protein